MTLNTYEMRWFFEKPPRWFGEAVVKVESRTDYYAPIRSKLSSVKLREDRLELKCQLDSLLCDGWPVEGWSKISLSLGSIDRELFQSPPPGWLPVTKRRRTQALELAPMNAPAAEGDECRAIEMEWTELQFRSRRYWSFAIESPSVLGPRSVIDAMSAGLHRSTMSELPRTNTAYPVWLAARLPSP